MERAFSIGVSISEFWEITPYELSIACRGYGKRKEREAEEYVAKFKNEQDLILTSAYLLSRWVWQKKVDIESILNVKPEKKKEMSADAMLAMVKMLNAQLGGEVRVNGKTESNN